MKEKGRRMGVSYNRLWKLLIDKKMSASDISSSDILAEDSGRNKGNGKYALFHQDVWGKRASASRSGGRNDQGWVNSWTYRFYRDGGWHLVECGEVYPPDGRTAEDPCTFLHLWCLRPSLRYTLLLPGIYAENDAAIRQKIRVGLLLPLRKAPRKGMRANKKGHWLRSRTGVKHVVIWDEPSI